MMRKCIMVEIGEEAKKRKLSKNSYIEQKEEENFKNFAEIRGNIKFFGIRGLYA